MAEGHDLRAWEDLIPDALGIIFNKCSLREKMTVIPSVCTSWCQVVTGPYCWHEIDIEEWSSLWPEHIEKLLRILILRACGSLRKLCVSGLEGDEIFTLIAEHAGSLQHLRLVRSTITDEIVEQIAPKLSTITYLDVSYCNFINVPGLEAIGRYCKSLTSLRRNMHPVDVEDVDSQDDEAQAIAASMPRLKYLEMAYLKINDSSVLKVLASCPNLETLDIRGCWDVNLDDKFFKEKFPEVKVLGPMIIDDHYMNPDWADFSDYSDDHDDDDYEGFEYWDDDSFDDEFEVVYGFPDPDIMFEFENWG